MKHVIVMSLLAGIVLSNELVEEIFRNLAQQPYGTVAPLIAKMQNEATHQPTAPKPEHSTIPEPIPPEPK
jgi:hypothetical protein